MMVTPSNTQSSFNCFMEAYCPCCQEDSLDSLQISLSAQLKKPFLFKRIFDSTSYNNHLGVVIGTDLCNRTLKKKKKNKFKMTQEERCSFLSMHFSKYSPIFVGTIVEIVPS